MHRSCRFIILFAMLVWTGVASAATGKVIKVLPHLLDSQGRHMLAPSLYDRDAYQAELRKHPDKCSGVRFDVQWRVADITATNNVVLRVEVRGTAKNKPPGELRLEQWLTAPRGGHWTNLTLTGESYKELGGVTAWRVTLWAGDELLGEQKSFLW